MRSTPSSVILAVLAAATAIAIPAEGLRRTSYRDPVGILTVCYGSTTDIPSGKEYSISECKARLNADMLVEVEIVERYPRIASKAADRVCGGAISIGIAALKIGESFTGIELSEDYLNAVKERLSRAKNCAE